MILYKFQQIRQVYRLSKSENDFLKKIPYKYKQAWDGKLSDLIVSGVLPTNAKTIRNAIKVRIKANMGLPKVGQNRRFEHLEFY
jgi:hypothetical protein